MTLVNLAEFARTHGASKQAASKWKAKKYLVFSGDLVDLEASDRNMQVAGKGRFGRRTAQSTKSTTASTSTIKETTRRSGGLAVAPERLPSLAIEQAVTTDTTLYWTAEILLRTLPIQTVRPLIAELCARLRHGSIEILMDEGHAPPRPLAAWSDWEGFARSPISEVEWAELQRADHD